MIKTSKTFLVTALLAVVVSGPAFADDEGTKSTSTDCTSKTDASAQAGAMGDFYADPHDMARNEKAKSDERRYAASSPIPWQPGNPFRDDTAA